MIACISDSHIGRKMFSKSFFWQMMNYFETEFFPYLEKHKIKDILHLGDMVDNRNLIDNYIDGQFKKRFFKWLEERDITIHCLVGNHDSYYKNTIKHNYQQANLKEFKNVRVYDAIEIAIIGKYKVGMIPWLTRQDQIDEFPKPNEVDFLAGHFEVAGALMQGNLYSKKGLDYGLFKRYNLVLSGHFHATSQSGNFRYLGSQYQMDYRDYGNDKGFWVIKDDLKMDFVKNTSSPKFLKLFYLQNKDEKPVLKMGGWGKNLKTVTIQEAEHLASKNFVKFVIKQYRDQDLLERYFEVVSQNALGQVEIINESSMIEDMDIDKFEEDVKDDVDLNTIIQNFIEKSEFSMDGIDKKVLLEMMNDLHEMSITLQPSY